MDSEYPGKWFGYRSWPALAVILTGLFLNLYNIDIPTGYHCDEDKKIKFVKISDQDFRHPILLLQTARLITRVSNAPWKKPFVVSCRAVSVISGVLIAYLFFRVARKKYGIPPAFAAALALGASPIMVVHSHYFKEDMVFTLFSFTTLISLIGYCGRQSGSSAIKLGLAAGLALSAQYKGVLLILLIIMAPFFARVDSRRDYFSKLPIVFSVTALLFLAVNYPMFQDWRVFIDGLSYETRHAIEGHTVTVSPLSQYFSFHIVHSIAPGISWPFTLMGFAGLILMLTRWKDLGSLERITILYFFLFYLAHESTPLKPFPDFSRYMIPLMPALFFFTVFLIHAAADRFRAPAARLVGTLIITASLAALFYDSFLLDYHLNKDTRDRAKTIIEASGKKVLFERHSSKGESDIDWLADVDLKKARDDGVEVLVASSFNYGRFYLKGLHEEKNRSACKLKRKYDYLFSFPFREIRPAHRTYAYSNPVIRLIDINGK